MGEATAPPAWIVSRVCEAFDCVPSVAVRELEENGELVFDVLDARLYADTRAAIERAKEAKDEPSGMMADWVRENEYALYHERRARRLAED